MNDETHKNTKTQLALAIAQGDSVAAWACANGVPRQTAFLWAKDPLVRKMVESCRRRMMEEATRRMRKNSAWAADRIVTLAKYAESDSVKLAALLTIRANMTASLGPRLEIARGKRGDYSKIVPKSAK
jgi:hypothetical protein